MRSIWGIGVATIMLHLPTLVPGTDLHFVKLSDHPLILSSSASVIKFAFANPQSPTLGIAPQHIPTDNILKLLSSGSPGQSLLSLTLVCLRETIAVGR